jgi:hypothetical protein
MADFGNDLADFEAKVEQNIKLLTSKKAEARRAAALWLGESGEPHVIEPLVKLYQREKDSGVKTAIEYSLGKFRALEQALDRGEDDKVLALLKRVTNEGKLGKRLGIPTRTLVMVMIGLLISFGVLVAAFFATDGMSLFSGTGGPEATEVASVDLSQATPLPQLLAEINSLLFRTRNDLNTLQTEYQAVVDGTFTGSCDYFFNEPAPHTLSDVDSAAYPALSALVDRLNTTIENLNSTKTFLLNQVCTAATPMTSQDVVEPIQTIATAQSELTSIELDLSQLQAGTPNPEEATTDEAVTEEAATEEPATSTPVAGANPSDHFIPLTTLIDEMTQFRGPAVLLEQYWSDVETSGTTGGCGQPDPAIPENYVIPEEAATASPELKNTVDAVNLGLQLLREGWRDFRNACDGNSLSAGLARGQIAVSAINNAFESARNQLDALRGG